MVSVVRRTLFVSALVALLSPAARADQIDRALTLDAAEIAKAVRSLGGKSVAVLKFRSQIGTGTPTFRAGTLGADMVHRVENVLVLTADPNNPKPELLTGAGEQAARQARESQGAFDWTTPEGRAKLFGLELPVAWDDRRKEKPDAFVTGTVRVSADLKDVFIDLVGFTRDDPSGLRALRTIGGGSTDEKTKAIRMDRGILTSLGRTFTVPREIRTAKSRQFVAAEDAAVTNAGKNPDGTQSGPVKLEIVYDDSAVVPEPNPEQPGELRVRTPASGQRVKFFLTNTGPERVAVLLTVNGLNTVAMRGEDLANPSVAREKFQPWVLEPAKRYEVAGFYQNLEGKVRPFRVLTEDESNQAFDALSPAYAGKIHMIVFGNKPQATVVPGPAATETPDPEPVTIEHPIQPPKRAEPVTDPADRTPPEKTPVAERPPVEGPKTVEAASDTLRELNEGIEAGGLVTVGVGLGRSRSLADAQAAVAKQVRLSRRADGTLAIPGRSRSIVIGGQEDEGGGKIDTVKFDYHPLPLQSLVIGYYSPKRPGQ